LTRILLVEADPGIRGALSRCINRHEGCCCMACPTASAARRQRAASEAVLCLVNRDLAGSMSLPNSDQIGTLAEGVPAVSYGVHMDSEELFALTPGGASGYVLKRTAPEHILEPVLGVLAGGRVAAETLLRSSQAYFQRLLQSGPTGKPTSKAVQLTQREQDVLNLMSKGYVDKEIAPALGISSWTVHEHVKRIFEKLQVHSRTEAVLACLQK
jgi:DNA-binding NarL/FixJ family response regulator